MEPLANELWKSCARSRLRRRALVLFSSMGEMYLNQAAKMIEVPPSRALALLYGDGKGYARELGLVTLGLVQERSTPRGRAFEITTKGRRKARSMTAAQGRRASAEAWRKIAERAAAELEKKDAPRAGADGWSFTWSFESGSGATPPD